MGNSRRTIALSAVAAFFLAYPVYVGLYQIAFFVYPSRIHSEWRTLSITDQFSDSHQIIWGVYHSCALAVVAGFLSFTMLRWPLFISKKKSISGFISIFFLAVFLVLLVTQGAIGFAFFLFLWYYLPLLYVYIGLSVIMAKPSKAHRSIGFLSSLVLLLSIIVLALPVAPDTGDGMGQSLLSISVSLGLTLLVAVGVPMLLIRGIHTRRWRALILTQQ